MIRSMVRALALSIGLIGFAALATAQDPVKLNPQEYKVEFENDAVRVVRAKRVPHSKVPMHSHPDYVVVYLTDVHQNITLPDGTVNEVRRKAGEVTVNPPTTHAEESLSDQPFEVILVELKNAPKKNAGLESSGVKEPALAIAERYAAGANASKSSAESALH